MRSDYKSYHDTHLLTMLAAGHDRALQELFDRYWESLFTRACNFLENEDAAKDCVQDVFISLWQHGDPSSILHLNHYLHQAVRFRALRAVKENKAGSRFESRLYAFDQAILSENSLELKELKILLQKLIASLPEDQRLIFIMHREEALTYRQIAEKLDISVKTVEKKMSQTLRFLRSNMKETIPLFLICII